MPKPLALNPTLQTLNTSRQAAGGAKTKAATKPRRGYEAGSPFRYRVNSFNASFALMETAMEKGVDK